METIKELHEKSLCVLDMMDAAKQRIKCYAECIVSTRYWAPMSKAAKRAELNMEMAEKALRRLHIYHRNLLYKLLHSCH